MNIYEEYIKLLLKWNKIHSLTNYNKKELKKQIEITLKAIEYLPKNIKTAMDIGTGAGIPGLVLAMKMKDVHWYLVEPLQKRYSFLNYAKLSLKLQNVTIIPHRIETIDSFDVDLITSRAVKNIKFLIDLANNFISKETIMLLYKGQNVENELLDVTAQKNIINYDKINYVFLKDIKKC